MSGQSSVRKMSYQVDVMQGNCVQEFEPELVLQKVILGMLKRIGFCLRENGGHFEHML